MNFVNKVNLWGFVGSCDAILIPTSGFYKAKGTLAVMGAGVAHQAAVRYPELPRLLGAHLAAKGNYPAVLAVDDGTCLVSFPTKPREMTVYNERDLGKIVKERRGMYGVGDFVPGFWCKADKDLIRESCSEVCEMAEMEGWSSVALPAVGTGAGDLRWRAVKPILEEYFDGRYTCIEWKRF